MTKEERKGKAWSYKAQKCRMLGYDEQCKDTLIVLTVPNGKIVSRKDCIFDEALCEQFDIESVFNEYESDELLDMLENDINTDNTSP